MIERNLELTQARYAQYAADMQRYWAEQSLIAQAAPSTNTPSRLFDLLKNQSPRLKQQFYMGTVLD